MGTEAEPREFWGITPGIDRAARGVGFLFVLVALLLTAIGIRPLGAVLVWLICLLVLLVVWRCYLVPYVELTEDRLVIQGAFATHSVPYADIRDVRPGIYGLRIETATQGRVIGWAVQKSKFAEWSHRRTVADDVAEQITTRVRDAKAAVATTR